MDDAIAILEEFEIQIVPKNVAPAPGQTRAVATLQKIVESRGYDNARFVIQTLSETQNNKACFDESTLWTVSDIIKVFEKHYPAIIEKHVERFFEFFDKLPVGYLEAHYAHLMDGITSRRGALGGMICERAVIVFGQPQMDLFSDRRKQT